MENFTIKEQIGKGAQATVYLVERQQDKQKFVLKKVECFDESEANKAFKEASVLRDLQHVYVSGYKEFFVLWEKQDSSVYICILMDYFPKGTLLTVLSKYREKKEVIDEEQIKQWLGQVLEALMYAHKKKILHRDIRPSNIYVQADDTLALGDFGVDTIMGDAITCTRANAGKKPFGATGYKDRFKSSMNYMAPECVSHGYSETCDIWSLGCVLFELVTAWLYNSDEAIAKLQQVRNDPGVLDEVFEDISKHYSDALISLLACMLKVNHTQRSTLGSLLNMPYVRKCLEMSDSSQLEKRKRLKSASTAKSEITVKEEVSRWPVPKGQGVLKVLEYLANMVDYDECVKEALEYLLELSKSEGGLNLDPRGKKLVAMAMKNNMTDAEIQISGCNVLNSLVMCAEVNDVLFTPEVIAVLPLSMENHKDNLDVQYAASSLLMALAANTLAGEVIGHLGGVQDILVALRTHPNNAKLCSTCLSALWGLTVHGNNVKIATEEKGVKEVCNVLKIHMNSSEVAEAASASILALSLDEENLEIICDLDGVGLLIETIKTHGKNSKVVKNACLALASLVEIDEESAYRVLTNEGPGNTHIAGIPIIMKTYELHKDNAEVVESVVTLLMELAEYVDICTDLKSYNVFEQIKEVTKKFRLNKDIMGPCEKALERLQDVKQIPVPKTPSPEPVLQEVAGQA
ncbi:serine/threonine kinase-like domain-containing protein STKLD1 isoform X3 [Ruditapes philippinarum]|uniref:serine/threonine kinase-like domain-containing protein STKLD1 isoform X3 n=1 Tax=Ruditapes philippinarum TaxID=129788 RepID=UPI00295C2863|nr:serine/threonine kinase-like domain-containing protein STKLD1 isoform X3 [Ruditapes philippinarum]